MGRDEMAVRRRARGALEANYDYLQDLVRRKGITDPRVARRRILDWLAQEIGEDPEIRRLETDTPRGTAIWQWAGDEIGRFVHLLDLSAEKEKKRDTGEFVRGNMDYADIDNPQDIRAYLFQKLDDFAARLRLSRFTETTRRAARQVCREELKKMATSISDLPRVLTENEWEEFIEETLYQYEKKMP